MTDNERQFWNTSYNPKPEDPLLSSWRRFLIERGQTPEGVWRNAGKQRFKELMIEFLTEGRVK